MVDLFGNGGPNPECDRIGHQWEMVRVGEHNMPDVARVQRCTAAPCEVVQTTFIRPGKPSPEHHVFDSLLDAQANGGKRLYGA